MVRFSAVVIGLGQIGQGYDYDVVDQSVIKTHAAGFAHHPGYRLLAAVDLDQAARNRFERKFGLKAYADLSGLAAEHRPEVVAIAVPTDVHHNVFREVMEVADWKPRAVICEKPIARSTTEARRMLEIAERRECTLLVNYMRRFEPSTLELKAILQRGELGEIYKGTVWYGKGLFNNGSHFVDLLRFLLGEVTDIKVVDPGRPTLNGDPEPDLCLRIGMASVYFLAGRDECFSLADFMLLGTRGLLVYRNAGHVIEIRRSTTKPHIQGAARLSDHIEQIPTDLKRYQWHVLEALYGHLTRGTPLSSDGRTATDTLAVAERAVGLMRAR